MLAGRRTLALDWGKARIGLAITDESGAYIQTLPTLHRKNRAADLGELSRIIEANSVFTLVVGAPLHLDGSVSPSSSQAEQLGRTLAKRCGVELVLWDERLTSVEAEEILTARGGKRKPGDVDRIAAALILQSYIESAPKPAGGGAR
jgi:putative Holliday junction resolvase